MRAAKNILLIYRIFIIISVIIFLIFIFNIYTSDFLVSPTFLFYIGIILFAVGGRLIQLTNFKEKKPYALIIATILGGFPFIWPMFFGIAELAFKGVSGIIE
jgi:hypothetical protein